MRPGSGRPPKPAHSKQRNRVVVLLTDEELASLDTAAAEEPLGTYVRSVLLRHLSRRKK